MHPVAGQGDPSGMKTMMTRKTNQNHLGERKTPQRAGGLSSVGMFVTLLAATVAVHQAVNTPAPVLSNLRHVPGIGAW